MHPAGDHGPIGSHHQLVKRMLVYLANMSRVGNGEDKRRWRHSFPRRMFEARASLGYLRFDSNRAKKVLHLPVGGSLDKGSFTLTQLLPNTLQPHILIDH